MFPPGARLKGVKEDTGAVPKERRQYQAYNWNSKKQQDTQHKKDGLDVSKFSAHGDTPLRSYVIDLRPTARLCARVRLSTTRKLPALNEA